MYFYGCHSGRKTGPGFYCSVTVPNAGTVVWVVSNWNEATMANDGNKFVLEKKNSVELMKIFMKY